MMIFMKYESPNGSLLRRKRSMHRRQDAGQPKPTPGFRSSGASLADSYLGALEPQPQS